MSAQGQDPAAPAAETAAAPPEGAQPAGLDRVYEQMEAMAAGQKQMLDALTQITAPPEEEDEPEFDPSEFYDETGEMTEEGARALISDMVDQRVEKVMAPREAARLVRERDDLFEALKDEYPQLQDEKIANEVIQKALGWAHTHNKGLIERPEFVDVIEWIYRSEHGSAPSEDEEEPQPGRTVVLEGASGARRESKPQQVDWQKRVIDAAQSASTRI